MFSIVFHVCRLSVGKIMTVSQLIHQFALHISLCADIQGPQMMNNIDFGFFSQHQINIIHFQRPNNTVSRPPQFYSVPSAN